MYGHSQLVDEFVVVGDDCRYEAAEQEEAGGGEGGGGRGRSAGTQHGQSHGDGFWGEITVLRIFFYFSSIPSPEGEGVGRIRSGVWTDVERDLLPLFFTKGWFLLVYPFSSSSSVSPPCCPFLLFLITTAHPFTSPLFSMETTLTSLSPPPHPKT